MNSGLSAEIRDKSALGWLAYNTGSVMAFCGSVAMDGDSGGCEDEIPARLSYAKGYAETDPDSRDNYVNLKPPSSGASPFVYFVDGSRMVWKVAEFANGGRIWPIVAGQIGIACCRREDGRIFVEKGGRIYRTILSIPQCICGLGANDAENRRRIEEYREGVNDRLGRSGYGKIDNILTYTDKDDEYEKTNLAVSRIQSLMVAVEKQAIYDMAEAGKLSDGRYLIKDGTLEYRDERRMSDLTWKKMEGRLQYVVGVSKKFNADLFEVRVKTQRQSAAAFISGLKKNQRTQAFLYEPQGDGGPKFAVWYVRIRDHRLGQSVFDGVLKAEMHLVGDEAKNGKLTLAINRLSEALISERNPVCYGKDERWANHIYPVYKTEEYLKSGFAGKNVLRAMVSQGGKR